MIYSLPGFLNTYWPYLLGVVAIICLLCFLSERLRNFIKKIAVIAAVIFVLAAGYELITGNNLFTLPGSIERELTSSPQHPESGHRYYESYEKRYGEKPPDE